MKISEYLREDCCIVGLAATDKDGAIREIAQKTSVSGKVINVDKFVADILERESLGSTGIGQNIAIPHARTDAVSGFVIGFGQSKGGVDFKSLDDQRVNLIFLMGADPRELNFYLRALAELSKLLMNKAFRQALMAIDSPTQAIDVIKKFEG
jgi:PTS system fructose-specific IIC component